MMGKEERRKTWTIRKDSGGHGQLVEEVGDLGLRCEDPELVPTSLSLLSPINLIVAVVAHAFNPSSTLEAV